MDAIRKKMQNLKVKTNGKKYSLNISFLNLQSEIAEFNSKANQLEEQTKTYIQTADQCDCDIRFVKNYLWQVFKILLVSNDKQGPWKENQCPRIRV